MKILVIVESVKKAKMIQNMLNTDNGNKYIVCASMGHVMDLPISEMGVDENTFEEKYVINPDKNKNREKSIKNIIENSEKCDKIILASDLDREGETIAWSLKKMLNLKNNYERIKFSDTTKKSIINSLRNPLKIDMNLVNSQRTRRIIDRLIGYHLSPLLQKNININAKSAGRVQSVVVKMILEKELEIEKFFLNEHSSYFKTSGYFPELPICSLLQRSDDEYKRLEKKDIHNFLNSKNIYKIEDIKYSDTYKKPPPPFKTSSLQQECSSKLGLSNKQTMLISQKLYDSGLITYMRTDSIILSDESMISIKKYIIKNYEEEYYNETKYVNTTQNTQEAHECIRPTKISKKKEDLEDLDDDCLNVYELIWKRTIASQMSPSEYENVDISISISNYDDLYYFTTIKKNKFDGYLILYGIDEKKYNIPKKGKKIIPDKIIISEEYKNPPTRYSETTLNKKMEICNIGRPATTTSIISKILERKYVEKKNNPGIEKKVMNYTLINDDIKEESKILMLGKESNKYHITPLGKIVTEFLMKNFKEIMDYEYTSTVEKELDEIARGEKKRLEILKKFYEKFSEELKKVKNENIIIGQCPESGEDIYICITKYGKTLKKGKRYIKITDNPTLEKAIELFKNKFPYELGSYKKKKITINKGKFGYFLRWGKKISGIKSVVDLEGAINEIKKKEKEKKFITYHEKKYEILNGKFGYYLQIFINGKRKNINIPSKFNPNNLSKDNMKEILKKHKL